MNPKDRPIDVSELIELIEWYERLKGADDCWIRYKIFENAIDEAPSIDIVRCKECKHWYRAIDESGTIERFNFSECTKGHYGNGLEFYCADGERREP